VIHTPASIRRTNRRLDRHNERKRRREAEVNKVLGAMTRGAALRRTNRPTRTIWSLTSCEFVTAETAAAVLLDPRVCGVGDSLFGSELSQTFRFVGGDE
jgi:hypothetical protein